MRDGEAGFTYIETLVALMIVTSLTVGMLLFVRGVWSGSREAVLHARDLRLILEADKALRKAACGIGSPWWLAEPEITRKTNAEYQIDGLDGIPDRALTVRIEDTMLTIQAEAEEPRRYLIPAGTTLEAEESGLNLALSHGNGSLTIRAPWAGRSLFDER